MNEQKPPSNSSILATILELRMSTSLELISNFFARARKLLLLDGNWDGNSPDFLKRTKLLYKAISIAKIMQKHNLCLKITAKYNY